MRISNGQPHFGTTFSLKGKPAITVPLGKVIANYLEEEGVPSEMITNEQQSTVKTPRAMFSLDQLKAIVHGLHVLIPYTQWKTLMDPLFRSLNEQIQLLSSPLAIPILLEKFSQNNTQVIDLTSIDMLTMSSDEVDTFLKN